MVHPGSALRTYLPARCRNREPGEINGPCTPLSPEKAWLVSRCAAALPPWEPQATCRTRSPCLLSFPLLLLLPTEAELHPMDMQGDHLASKQKLSQGPAFPPKGKCYTRSSSDWPSRPLGTCSVIIFQVCRRLGTNKLVQKKRWSERLVSTKRLYYGNTVPTGIRGKMMDGHSVNSTFCSELQVGGFHSRAQSRPGLR